MTPATNRIFISYAREDQAFAKRVHALLTNSGFNPWLDIHDILPGERWEVCIREALADAAFVLICLSPRSVDKRGFLQKEIRAALDCVEGYLDSDVYLIPVMLEFCVVPPALRDFQFVDCREDDWQAKLTRAIRAGFERRS